MILSKLYEHRQHFSSKTDTNMLSTDASRFLAQSQSRLSFSQNDPTASRNPLERQRGGNTRVPSRGYLQRRPPGSTYLGGAASQTSRFPFASRTAQPSAPLFYSATDEFREEDDGQEHEREVADLYALQQSRRDFGTGRLSESSEDDSRSDNARRKDGRGRRSRGAMGRGIRSSWTGDDNDSVSKPADADQDTKEAPVEPSVAGSFMSRTTDRLVDVELASTIHEDEEENASTYRDTYDDDDPPSLQQFRKPGPQDSQFDNSRLYDNENTPFMSGEHATSPDRESVPTALAASPSPKALVYDSFWASLFMIDCIAMLSSFILVLLHTSAPGKSSAFGDTIYTTMRSSFYLLAVDTLVATIVALVWIAALRSFVRPLVLLILVAVPTIALSFSLYPFVSSFKGTWHGNSVQDKAMRWLAFLPAAFAGVWIFTAYRGRHSLDRAIDLLQFATRILGDCPTLIVVGFGTLGLVIAWTWTWMLMFTRVFLGGHTEGAGKRLFIINTSTWWLGIFFVLTYLWTLGVISGVQRATTAASTSQWYFYRNAAPAPSPQSVVRAAFSHATTKIFGTICLSTLLALAVRVPLLILPGRVAGYISLFFYSFVPTSIATLTNPLTLTYAAIHSQPLGISARGLSELTFVASTGTAPTTTLTPHAFSRPYHNNRGTPSLVAYRLAKLLLHATRFITSLAFGFGGWVSTARSMTLDGTGVRGSMYAYVVGLVAGAIGWAVLGAMEGVLGGVLDAVVVCWGSEMQSHGGGQARFCREAGELLADEGAVGL